LAVTDRADEASMLYDSGQKIPSYPSP